MTMAPRGRTLAPKLRPVWRREVAGVHVVIVRAVALCLVVLAILVGFGQTYPEELSLQEAVFQFQMAMAQEPSQTVEPTGTSPAFPTPTIALTDNPVVPTETLSASTATPTLDVGGTQTPTPTSQPTETGTPVTETPSATPTPEATEVVIDASGGTITSVDGNAVLTFPEGAVTEPVTVRIAQKPRVELPAELPPVDELVSTWDFSATELDSGTPVHQFGVAIDVDLQYTIDDLFGLDASDMRYFSYDEPSATWLESETTAVGPFEWSVALTHFSTQAAGTGDKITMPTLLDAATVNLNTGSASFSLPLQVPASVGKVTPQLAITYDSGRVDETGNGSIFGPNPAGWLGIGWDLTMPHISRAGDRWYLNMNGYGSQLVWQSDPGGGGSIWKGRDEQFLDITSSCTKGALTASACSWKIRDRSGVVYDFGTSTDSRRYYKACSGLGCPPQNIYTTFYQWDLKTATDAHGNAATYTYSPILGRAAGTTVDIDSVVSSYPTSITYPGAKIEFNLSTSTSASVKMVAAGGTTALQTRPDVAWCPAASQPSSVFETQRLASIMMKSWDGSAYTTSNSYAFTVQADSSSSCDSSSTKLQSVGIKGKAGGELTLMEFAYTSMTAHKWATSYPFCIQIANVTNDRLTTVKNGFGGLSTFDYEDAERAGNCDADDTTQLGRFLVENVTTTSGSAWTGSTAVTTDYDYATGPNYWNDKLTGESDDHYVYRGYGEVTETDAAGDKSVHYYTTTGELSGRETKIERKAANNDVWHTITNEFESIALGSGAQTVWFNRLLRTTTKLKDNTESKTEYAYENTYGTITSITSDEDVSDGSSPCLKTEKTPWARRDSTVYLVLPRLEQTKACSDGTTVYAENENFYDGAGASGTTTPVVGNLTASRRMTDRTLADSNNEKYIYTFNSYYSNGLPKESSVPIYANATMTPTGGQTGWVPTDKGRVLMEYDSASIEAVGTPTPVGRFPKKQTVYVYNETGAAEPTQVTEPTYDRVQGVVSKVIEPTGMETETTYDEYGRVWKVWRTLDGVSAGVRQPGVEYEYHWGEQNPPTGDNYTRVRYRYTAGASLIGEERHCLDGLGRERQTIEPFGSAVNRRMTYNVYDGRDLITNTQVFGVGTSVWCIPGDYNIGPNNYVLHDPLGHVESLTNSAAGVPSRCTPSCVQSAYSGLVTTTLDQLNHKTETQRDGWGRTQYTRGYTGTSSWTEYAETEFVYDTLGNLAWVKPEGLTSNSDWTSMTYDALGRKTSMTDPDLSGYSSGTTRIPWNYKYDSAGNLVQQIDARGVQTDLKYDSLNRLRQKIYTSPNSYPIVVRPSLTYQYDTYDSDTFCSAAAATAIGRLTKVDDGTVTTRYCYDERGREIRKKVSLNVINDESGCSSWSRNYVVKRTYDAADRLTILEYPDGEQVQYTYADGTASGGFLKSVAGTNPTTTFIKANGINYHVSGGVLSIAMETGSSDQTTTYNYDERYLLRGITTTNGTTLAQDLDYTYLENGNVDTIVDHVGTTETLDYAYDDLNRLIEMKINTVVSATYAYNESTMYGGRIGNMTSKMEDGVSYTFGHASEHIHAPTSWRGYGNSYDKNGNATQTDGDLYNFDVENRLSRFTAWSPEDSNPRETTYLYDGSGEMVRRKADNLFDSTDPEKEVYIDGIYQEKSKACGGADSYTKYYTALGRVIAKRTNTAGSMRYMLADHLASTTTEVNPADGTVTLTAKYWPFGAPRNSTTPPERGYTGQQREVHSSAGLYYYHARFYSPAVGRFVSADPIVVDGLNRYAMAKNSPVNYRDSSGYCAWKVHDCAPESAKELISCAFGDCSDWGVPKEDAIRLSQWALQQNIFWVNFANLITGGGASIDWDFAADILGRVMDGARLSGLFFEVLPRSFFAIMSRLLAVNERFFATTLYDLAFGTELTRYLVGDRAALEEAELWTAYFWNTNVASKFNDRLIGQALIDLTLDLASKMTVDEVKAFSWGFTQQELLHFAGYPVALPSGILGGCNESCLQQRLRTMWRILFDLGTKGIEVR